MASCSRFRVPVLGGILAVLLLSACGSNDEPAATGSADAAPISTAKPGSTSDTWVKWDKGSCKIVPAESPGGDWEAVLRPSKVRLGLGEQTEGIPLIDAFNTGVRDAAEKAGADLVVANYLYPDASKALEGARSIAARQADAVISFNVLTTVMDGVMGVYDKACTPVVQITAKAPNAVVFGVDNAAVGDKAGAYLAKWAKDKGWSPSDTTVVGLNTPSLGEDINKRPDGCVTAVQRDFAGVGSSKLELPASTTADAQSKMTDWLTANPDKQHVLSCVIADTIAVGVQNAAKGAGREDQMAVVGIGGAPDAVQSLQSGTSGSFIATVDFGFKHYADFVVPMALDLLDGKAVPDAVFSPLSVVEAK